MLDVRKKLVQAGVRPSHIGLDYLVDEILAVAKSKKKDVKFQILHAEIARKYNTTASAVDKGIRNAIGVAMNNNPNFIRDIGGGDYHSGCNITLSDCVYAIAYQLQDNDSAVDMES